MNAFATCSKCGKTWPTMEDLLADAELHFNGYQVHFERLAEGLFLITHACGTTFTLPANAFRALYTGPIFARRARGQPDGPGHCLREDDTEACPAECECTYVQAILAHIRAWPKRA